MKRLLICVTSTIIIVILLQFIHCASVNNQPHGAVDVDNNEFAEFEDVDTVVVQTKDEKISSSPTSDDEEEVPVSTGAATGRGGRPSDDDDDAVLEVTHTHFL